MGLSLAAQSRTTDISGWPPAVRLRYGIEQDDGNLARCRVRLVFGETRGKLLLLLPDRGPLVRARHPRLDLHRAAAKLDRRVRVRGQVVIPVRVGRRAALGAEYRERVAHRLVHERAHPFGTGLGPGMVQQQDRGALEHPAYFSAVLAELLDAVLVEVLHVGHGRLPSDG